MATPSTWPYNNRIGESTTQVNIRMVHKLLERKGKNTENLLAFALGQNFDRKRHQSDLTYTDIKTITGLDTGFLCILASGKALIEEIREVESLLVEANLLDPIDWRLQDGYRF